jgi:hypothetical protein
MASPFVLTRDGEPVPLSLGGNEIGRALLGPRWTTVSRRQVTLTVSAESVQVTSGGTNPTFLRPSSSSPWATIAKGETAALPSGGQIALDCKNIEGSVMTLERPLTPDLAAATSAVTIAPPLASPASPELAVAAAEAAAAAPTPATAEPPPAADTPMPDAPTEMSTAAFEPWTCTACTFVHDEPEHAALHRCSLCGEPRGGGRKRERSDEWVGGGGGGGGGAGVGLQSSQEEEAEEEEMEEEEDDFLYSDGSDDAHDAFAERGLDEQKIDEVPLTLTPHPSPLTPHPSPLTPHPCPHPYPDPDP